MNDIKIILLVITFILSIIACLCKYLCNSPGDGNSVMASADHTTNVNATSQLYILQPTAAPGPFQTHRRASYQPAPAQPDDPAELMTTSPSHEQPFPQRPPPAYQEITGPAYPLQPMPSSETVFIPCDPLYPSEGTVHEYNVLDSTDFLTSSACDPEFVIH